MAMAVKQQQQGSSGRQQPDVKVKVIETRFISSDAASFKAVVQRLTGKSPSSSSSSPAPTQPQRPRPCRQAFVDAGWHHQQQQAGWGHDVQQAGNGGCRFTAAPVPVTKQEPPRMEELCDFSDLLYAAAGGRRDGGFPY